MLSVLSEKLSNRWRVLHSKTPLQPDGVIKVVKATCILHNFLTTKTESEFISLTPNHTMLNLHDSHAERSAEQIRTNFVEYFNAKGGFHGKPIRLEKGYNKNRTDKSITFNSYPLYIWRVLSAPFSSIVASTSISSSIAEKLVSVLKIKLTYMLICICSFIYCFRIYCFIVYSIH